MLSHYHAVRVPGASGCPAHSVICSEATRALIVERGAQDMGSESRPSSGAWRCGSASARRKSSTSAAAKGWTLKQFRDEAKGLAHPRIWTAARDVEMWQALKQGMPMKGAEAH